KLFSKPAITWSECFRVEKLGPCLARLLAHSALDVANVPHQTVDAIDAPLDCSAINALKVIDDAELLTVVEYQPELSAHCARHLGARRVTHAQPSNVVGLAEFGHPRLLGREVEVV